MINLKSMEITYLSNSFFKIKLNKIVILVGSTKDKLPKVNADVVCFSEKLDNKFLQIKPVSREETLIIDEPGEYEIAGVSIFGINLSSQEQENIGFIFENEGARTVHLGNLSRELREKEIEEINGVSALFIPVGGGEVVNSEKALKLIANIEPDIIVPMQYLNDTSSLKLEESLEDFLKASGIEKIEALEKINLSFSESDEPAKKIVVLKEKSN
jgi:L-ascorbate metabolism protein UlaG (beta-lactamase superfamily)